MPDAQLMSLQKNVLRFGLLLFPLMPFFVRASLGKLAVQSYGRATGQRQPAPLMQCTYPSQSLSTDAHQKQDQGFSKIRIEKRNLGYGL